MPEPQWKFYSTLWHPLVSTMGSTFSSEGHASAPKTVSLFLPSDIIVIQLRLQETALVDLQELFTCSICHVLHLYLMISLVNLVVACEAVHTYFVFCGEHLHKWFSACQEFIESLIERYAANGHPKRRGATPDLFHYYLWRFGRFMEQLAPCLNFHIPSMVVIQFSLYIWHDLVVNAMWITRVLVSNVRDGYSECHCRRCRPPTKYCPRFQFPINNHSRFTHTTLPFSPASKKTPNSFFDWFKRESESRVIDDSMPCGRNQAWYGCPSRRFFSAL